MVCEPTVEQIVDRVVALRCGESCAITLNPRVTRVDNLKWLLPICVEQFGTRIAIDQWSQGASIVLWITATQSRRQIEPKPVERERAVGERPVPAGYDELYSEIEEEALALA